MAVLLSNAQRKYKILSRTLKQRAQKILDELDLGTSELSILVVNDARIRKLNAQYRGKDCPTDVLSFQQDAGGIGDASHSLLGDVVVSAETASRQAGEHDLSLDEELILLIIHGILHLLGWDHDQSPQEEKKMRQKTKQLFSLIFPGRQPGKASNF